MNKEGSATGSLLLFGRGDVFDYSFAFSFQILYLLTWSGQLYHPDLPADSEDGVVDLHSHAGQIHLAGSM